MPKFEQNSSKLAEECKGLKELEEEDKKALDEIEPNKDLDHLKGVKGIPDFWKKVIKTSGALKSIINEKDGEAMEHLVKVESIPSKDGKDEVQTLKFHFKADNDFFKNTLLEVKCWMEEGGEESMVKKTEASEIEWLEGKDTTKKKIKKK